jgi:hypothetical protein
MKNKDICFPQFRMLSNGKSLYKIINDRYFEEIQIIGTKKLKFEIHAIQYPEMLKIQDMLSNENNLFLEIDELKWLEFQ